MPGRYNGPLLPRIAGKRIREGTVLTTTGADSRELREQILVGVAALAGVLTVVYAINTHQFPLSAILFSFSTSLVLITGVRQYLIKRRLSRASLLVNPWPIRLGDEVHVKFRATLRKATSVAAMDVQFKCEEEVTSGSGKEKRTRHASMYVINLNGTHRQLDGRKLTDEWQFNVPVEMPPSLSVRDNAIRWLIDAKIGTEGVDVPARFELLVLPEVVA